MNVAEQHVVLRHRDAGDLRTLEAYRAIGGYAQLERAVRSLAPEEVAAVVTASGLRGRGGAGFPTGRKWSLVSRDTGPRYVVANADESEPGTFKDHEIVRCNPHQLLEGAALAAYAVGASTVYVYCRGEWWQEMSVLRRAVAEATSMGLLGHAVFGTEVDLHTHVVGGAGAYICGEETALLSSMEGQRGEPRRKPPYPAQAGLYARPTVVNNVETMANLPPILANGADWFRSLGTDGSPGTKVFSLSGHVEKPGNYELPLGTPLRELLELGGGVWRGRSLKAILPAGASGPALAGAGVMDLALDWESVQAAGSALGSASVIVLDDTTNMAWVAHMTSRFFRHESCGKCTPCREGTWWLDALYRRLVGGGGSAQDVSRIAVVIDGMEGACFCPLGESAQCVPRSTLALFPDDYESLLAERSRPSAGDAMADSPAVGANGSGAGARATAVGEETV